MTPDEARQIVIDGINYAAYRETDSSLHDADKNRLFGSEHYSSGRPVYEPSPWTGPDFEKKMANLLVRANDLNCSVPAFAEAQRLLEGEGSPLGRVIRRAKHSAGFNGTMFGHKSSVQRRSKWRIAKDYMLYCAIGVSVALLAIFYGNHLAETKQNPESSVKWIGFIIMTGLVFFNAIRSNRDSWAQRRYWGLLLFLAAVHLSVGIIVVLRVGKVGLIDFAFATVLEYFVVSTFLNRFLRFKSR